MVELGFIHGRFQLFHNDHLNYALLAKEQCKKLIVGITSPENASLIREEVDPHRSEAASNSLLRRCVGVGGLGICADCGLVLPLRTHSLANLTIPVGFQKVHLSHSVYSFLVR